MWPRLPRLQSWGAAPDCRPVTVDSHDQPPIRRLARLKFLSKSTPYTHTQTLNGCVMRAESKAGRGYRREPWFAIFRPQTNWPAHPARHHRRVLRHRRRRAANRCPTECAPDSLERAGGHALWKAENARWRALPRPGPRQGDPAVFESLVRRYRWTRAFAPCDQTRWAPAGDAIGRRDRAGRVNPGKAEDASRMLQCGPRPIQVHRN